MIDLLQILIVVAVGIGLGELLYRAIPRRHRSAPESLPASCGCPTPPVPVQLSTGETVAWLCPACLADAPDPDAPPPTPPRILSESRDGITTTYGERRVLIRALDGTLLGHHPESQAVPILRHYGDEARSPDCNCAICCHIIRPRRGA